MQEIYQIYVPAALHQEITQYSLNRRWDGPQIWSRRFGEVQNFSLLTEIKPRIAKVVDSRYIYGATPAAGVKVALFKHKPICETLCRI